MIAFSPLAQGMLTDKYLNGIPDNSRAAKSTGHLQREQVTEEKINKVRQLNDLAKQRGQGDCLAVERRPGDERPGGSQFGCTVDR